MIAIILLFFTMACFFAAVVGAAIEKGNRKEEKTYGLVTALCFAAGTFVLNFM